MKTGKRAKWHDRKAEHVGCKMENISMIVVCRLDARERESFERMECHLAWTSHHRTRYVRCAADIFLHRWVDHSADIGGRRELSVLLSESDSYNGLLGIRRCSHGLPPPGYHSFSLSRSKTLSWSHLPGRPCHRIRPHRRLGLGGCLKPESADHAAFICWWL